jgi:hypothetical protein
MAIDDELDGLDPVALMESEATRVETHFGRLSEDAWQQPSRCQGWTARVVVLLGRVSELMQAMAARGVTSIDDFNAAGIAGLDGVPNHEVLHAFSRDDADTRHRFRERGDGEVDSSVGAYSARWQAFHLAGELATHADDVYLEVAPDEHELRLDWRVRFSRFALREAKPHLNIEATGGRTRVQGDGIDVELDDHDFVEAVAGRANTSIPDEVRTVLSTMP